LNYDTADYSATSAGVQLALSATSGSGSAGAALGDTLSGIEKVIGSAGADTFILSGGDWDIDGAGGRDLVRFADSYGAVSDADLAGVFSNIEELDFRQPGVQASLTIDSDFIRDLVGAGASSELTLYMNANDSWQIDTAVNANTYTQSTVSGVTTVVFYSSENRSPAEEVARLVVQG
jgi:hypothetical protein